MYQQNSIVNIQGQQYQIGQTLGAGSQGAVQKGKSKTGEEVAIKTQNQLSQTEYEILQKLQSEPQQHIIGIKEIQRDCNGKVTIVRELADQELYDYMTNDPEYSALTKYQKTQMFAQMVMAVNELHQLGYFHRDLKPENFVVFKKDQNGYVKTKLIDLGLAKQKGSLTQTKNIGTPYYMAPEIFDGSLFYDNSVDSWALGCIWFEMLTGETLFQGTSQNEIYQQIKFSSIDMRFQKFQQLFDWDEKKQLLKLIDRNAAMRDSAEALKNYFLKKGILSNINQIQPIKMNLQPQLQQQPSLQQQSQLQQQQFQQQQFQQQQFSQQPNFQNQNQFQQLQPQQYQFQQQQLQQPQFQQPQIQPKVNNNFQANQNQAVNNFNNNFQQVQKIQQQQQIEYVLKQQLEKDTREKVEQENAKATEKRIREAEEQQQQKHMEFMREQEQQLQIKLKKMEDEQKKKNQEAQKKIEQDKIKLEQIEQELQLMNQMEKIRKQQEDENQQQQKEYKARLQKEEEEKSKKFLEQKQEEIQQRVAQEMHQQYLLKYNQELQEKKRKEESEKQQQLIEMKNKASRTIKSIKELTEKFIQNLEEKHSQSTQGGFQNNNLYGEYSRLIQNYIEQFRNKLESVRQDENRLQKIDQYLAINVAQEIEEKYSHELAKIVFEQSNVQSVIAKKQKQVEEQQSKKEQIEQQSNLLKQQLLENKSQYQNTNVQIENKETEFNKNLDSIKQKIQLLSEQRYQKNFQGIQNKYNLIAQSIFQIKQESSNQTQYQEMQAQIYQISQLTFQLIGYKEELSLLIQQKEELIKELENFNQDSKNKAKVQLEQFEDEALKYDQALKRHKNQKQQNHQLIQNMQQLNNQYNKELKEFRTIVNANSILQRLEILRLTNLLNQYLKDLENYDTQLINYFEEQIKIERQQVYLTELSKQAQQIKIKSQQSHEVLLQQLNEYQNISQETKNQIELLKRNYEQLIQEYLNELDKLKQENFEINLQNLEQQAQKYKSLIKKFEEKFDEKNRIAQNLILRLNEIKNALDQKLVYFAQFTLEISQIKEEIKQLNFSQGFEICDLIIEHKQKNEEKIEQLKQYFNQCFDYFNQNQNIYFELKNKIQTKKIFQAQRIQISSQLDQIYKLSQEKMKQLEELQLFIQRQFQKIKFEGSVEELKEANEYFKKLQKTQLQLEQLHEQVVGLHQNCQNNPEITQDFVSKIKQDLEGIKQEIKTKSIQQINKFNQCLDQNTESLVVQIYINTIFSIYITNEYYNRIIRQQQQAEEKKKNQTQLEKDQEEQAIVNAQLKKWKDDIERGQHLKSKVQELINEQNQSQEKQQKLLIVIRMKNKMKLNPMIKNQQLIKEVIELMEFQDFCRIIIFKKLTSLS